MIDIIERELEIDLPILKLLPVTVLSSTEVRVWFTFDNFKCFFTFYSVGLGGSDVLFKLSKISFLTGDLNLDPQSVNDLKTISLDFEV